jgi:DNA polymerase-1
MLLQVHDELIFELPDDEVQSTISVVKNIMENAPFPALNLKVALKVEAQAAQNWNEAH